MAAKHISSLFKGNYKRWLLAAGLATLIMFRSLSYMGAQAGKKPHHDDALSLPVTWNSPPPPGDEVIIQLPCGKPFILRGLALQDANIVGEFTDDVYKICDTDVAEGDTVIDIGGNIGTFAIATLLQHPSSKVLSVEPLVENQRYLMYNAVANGVQDRITILAHGITSDSRTLSIAYDSTNPANSRQDPSGLAAKVPTRTLSDVIGSVPGFIPLLKIDCEGCEREVLLSTEALADRAKIGRVVGETHKIKNERLDCFARFLAKGARTFDCH